MTTWLFDKLQRLAQAHPDRCALGDDQGHTRWDELLPQIEQVRAQLSAHAPRRIGLLADNSRHWVLVDLAALQLGCPLIPIPLFFSQSQISHLMATAGIDTLVSIDRGNISVQTLQAECQPLHPGTAKVTFTSGSTGTPKGVCLSAEQQLRVARSLVERLQPLGITRHLCLLPLATLLENIAGVYTALLMGASTHLPSLHSLGMSGSSQLDMAPLLNSLQRIAPESMIALPQVLSALTAAGESGAELPQTLKFIAVGGARVGEELIRRARAVGLPAYEGYGLSECASVVTLNVPGQDRIGSAGAPLPHCQLQLSTDGELMIDSNGMLGYLGEPPQRGGCATSDLASIDGQGFVHILGRRKNLIINSFGRNLSPEWVEAEWMAQPGVHQAVIFGEARPFNVAVIHAPDLSDVELVGLADEINARLPDYARVRRWVRSQGPMTAKAGLYTANGRPRRDQIQSRFRSAIDALYGAQPDHEVHHTLNTEH